ncbi:MAG TPA: zinc dependent phospholipase C family protein [Terracidiphilus sp.]|nr:zinc dependent phospholipase C family protein [Terracidiphilus sp.]
MNSQRLPRWIALFLLLVLPWPPHANAYSLLTHEQLIDLTWQDSIVPLLLSRYPDLTPAQLEEARAYAYGGCVIQDIGYYPYGDMMYSNLTHYVRSGDFVVSLFRNAESADELAFAIGALSHYIGDTIGHATATNLAVSVEFPKLRAKYGRSVNYAQGRHQHVQAEFAFDIDEIAHHRVAPVHYLRHIGLQVSVRQLAVAYYQTYGITEDFTGTHKHRFNVSGYRFAVRLFIPRIAYAVTLLHRNHEPAEANSPERIEMDKEVAAVATENNWQTYRRKSGIGTYALAGIIFIIPKIGPLKMVAIKGPTETTEADYLHSVVLSVAALRRRLASFTPPASLRSHTANAISKATQAPLPPAQPLPANSPVGPIPHPANDPHHPLPNRDLDTGFAVQPGGYSLTDSTYADLLHRLTRSPTQPIPPGIKEDILAYYADPASPITTKKDPSAWAVVEADLATLATVPTSTAPEPYPTYGDTADITQ